MTDLPDQQRTVVELTALCGYGIDPQNPPTIIYEVRGDVLAKATSVLTQNMTSLHPADSNEDTEPALNGHLSIILRTLGYSQSPEAIKALSVLDIGCGSDADGDGGRFPPSFCRNLHKLGANVTGVDCYQPNKDGKDEGWKFHEVNLFRKGELNIIPNNSQDIIWTSGVIGHTEPGMTAPGLPGYAERDGLLNPRYRAIEDEIFMQALRVLRPGGLFIINSGNNVYRKIVDEDFRCTFEAVESGVDNFLGKNPPNPVNYKLCDPSILVFEAE